MLENIGREVAPKQLSAIEEVADELNSVLHDYQVIQTRQQSIIVRINGPTPQNVSAKKEELPFNGVLGQLRNIRDELQELSAEMNNTLNEIDKLI